MGLLRITVSRKSTQDEVIQKLRLEGATWVKGQTWTGKPTLFTLTGSETNATELYEKLVEVFNAELMDSCKYEWNRRNSFRLRRTWRRTFY